MCYLTEHVYMGHRQHFSVVSGTTHNTLIFNLYGYTNECMYCNVKLQWYEFDVNIYTTDRKMYRMETVMNVLLNCE